MPSSNLYQKKSLSQDCWRSLIIRTWHLFLKGRDLIAFGLWQGAPVNHLSWISASVHPIAGKIDIHNLAFGNLAVMGTPNKSKTHSVSDHLPTILKSL